MRFYNLLRLSLVTLLVTLLLLATGCGPDIEDDFNDVRYELVDQNGERVVFPEDLKGSPVVMGFIYTNCPDICSFITANLNKIHAELEEPGDTRFVLVTFDPERDTPAVMKEYARSFDMDHPPFSFLTGDVDEIDSMMKRLTVRSQVSYTKEVENGDQLYFLNHSDKILLLNDRAQLIMEYGGSMTPVNIIVEDLNNL